MIVSQKQLKTIDIMNHTLSHHTLTSDQDSIDLWHLPNRISPQQSNEKLATLPSSLMKHQHNPSPERQRFLPNFIPKTQSITIHPQIQVIPSRVEIKESPRILKKYGFTSAKYKKHKVNHSINEMPMQTIKESEGIDLPQLNNRAEIEETIIQNYNLKSPNRQLKQPFNKRNDIKNQSVQFPPTMKEA